MSRKFGDVLATLRVSKRTRSDKSSSTQRWHQRSLETFRGILEPWCSQWSPPLSLLSFDDATLELKDAFTQRRIGGNFDLTELNLSEAIVFQNKLYAATKCHSKIQARWIITGEIVWERDLENAIGVFVHGQNIHVWNDVELFDLNETANEVEFDSIISLPERFRSLCIVQRSAFVISYAGETDDDLAVINYHGLQENETKTVLSVQNCSLLGCYDGRAYAVRTIGDAQLIDFNRDRIQHYSFIGDFRSKIIGETLYAINEDRLSANNHVVNISTKSLRALDVSEENPIVTCLERCVSFVSLEYGSIKLIPSYR